MSPKRHSALICLVLLSVFAASCGPAKSTSVPAPTETAAPPTATFTPSPTLPPTATLSPTPSPTPVPAIGQLLKSPNWEATVLQATYRKSISIAGTVYTPKAGYMGFDIIMKVKNLNPETNPVTQVEHDVIVDETGQDWLATCWGVLDVAKAEGKDLLNLPFIGCQTGNIYTMKIENESYLRFHFTIKDTSLGQPMVFKFEDLPALPLIINK